jgi:hypothetical protein
MKGIRHDSWQKYLVSVNQLEKLTGFHFFTALKPELSAALKSKVDGQAAPVVAAIEPAQAQAAATPPAADLIPIGIVILSLLLLVCVAVLVLFFRTLPKAR